MSTDILLMEKAFEPLVAAAAGNASALLALAGQAHARGMQSRAIELAEDARALAPGNREIATIAAETTARAIPGFHVSIVKDEPRNIAFQQAIERHVQPGMRVLDVGSGTGLLAMIAARAGATQVFSCELCAPVAAAAKDIVQANGLADKVTILSKHSSAIDPEADMVGQADLVIAEIVGNDIVCERILPTMRDVVRRLAKPGARLIPQSGDIRVALAWWDGLDRQRMDVACGFDLSPFNRLLRPRHSTRPDDPTVHLRGKAANLFSFDFSVTKVSPDRAEIDLVATGGLVNGVVQWLRLGMDDEGVYENSPGDGAQPSSWACHFFPLAEPVDVPAGQTVRIAATHKGDKLRVWSC